MVDKVKVVVLTCYIVALKVDISSHYAWNSLNQTQLGLLINNIYVQARCLKIC